MSTACRSQIAIASHTNPVKTPHALCAFLSLIIFTMQGGPEGRFSHIYRATILQIWPHFISFKVEGRGYQPPFYALIFCEVFGVMKCLAENVWERLLPIVFRQKWNEIIKQLLNTINLGRRVISILTPWADHLSISAHKSQRQFAKELASDLAFLQSLTPRQHCSQLLYLSHCSGVKATKSLHRKRQEDETLVAASFSCVPDFSLVGLRERRSSICGGTSKIECFIILKRRSVADISAFCWKFSSADLLLCPSSCCKPLKILTKCFLQIMIIILCFLNWPSHF